MPAQGPQIVERDGDYVHIRYETIEVLAEMIWQGDDLVLRKFSIDGAGAGSLGLAKLRELGRDFARGQGAKRLLIEGTRRTTGANVGKMPRPVIITV